MDIMETDWNQFMNNNIRKVKYRQTKSIWYISVILLTTFD